MLPIRTPRVAAALLGQSDGWSGRPSQAAKFSDKGVREAYQAAFDKHAKLRAEEARRLSPC